jgi:translation initiation factor 2B subunit (eIF-2B alpha/beta/delta family)
MQEVLTQKGAVDVFLVGSDCMLPTQMVNKVGTRKLCEIARANHVPVFCCAGRWKIWDDIFPPPIEADLFEFVPLDLISDVLVPGEGTN